MNLLEFHGEYWEVDLPWSRPRIVETGRQAWPLDEASESYGLYRFERTHHREASADATIVRIGIAYNQTISQRLGQYSAKALDSYRRRGTLWVSHAALHTEARHRRARYEGVEHLLVFYARPVENQRKHTAPNDWYHIRNLGSRGALPHEIIYPVARVITYQR